MEMLQTPDGGVGVETLFKQLSGLIVPVILVVVAIVVLQVLKGLSRGRTAHPREREDLPYALQQCLMTKAERSFFGVLEEATDGSKYYIFPQVSLVSLVYVEKGTNAYQSYHNRIDRKTVDFALFSRGTLVPRLAIERDDSSHDREDRKERDAFLDGVLGRAGLPLLHVRARTAYDPKVLAEDISNAMRTERLDQGTARHT
jgi:hypothetical protein